MPFVLTTSEVEKQLQDINRDYLGRKSWEEQFGRIDLSKRQAESAVTYDYAKAVGEAYASSLAAEQNILASNLGQGFKREALDDLNRTALQEAYESYKQNYMTNMSNIQKSTSENVEDVYSNLTTQAENTVAMQESAYKYLQYLYENYKDTELFKDENWSKYLKHDETGTVSGLRTWAELSQGDDVANAMFDAQGNLTITGADFYDQMMNEISQGKYNNAYVSYDAWLAETNPELFEWASNYNPYDYQAYIDAQGNVVNSNLGSFRTLVGMTSGDETYAFIERYGGMSEKQIDNMFNKYQNNINDAVNASSDAWDAGEAIKSMQITIDNFRDVAKKLGIEEQLGREIGGWNNLAKAASSYLSETKTKGEAWIDAGLTTASATVTGAAIGNKIVPGGLGAGVGALVGLFVGVGASAVNASFQVVKNVDAEYDTHQLYTKAISAMVNYAQSQRRQKEIEFNNKNK